jgi:hypothetical protein
MMPHRMAMNLIMLYLTPFIWLDILTASGAIIPLIMNLPEVNLENYGRK